MLDFHLEKAYLKINHFLFGSKSAALLEFNFVIKATDFNSKLKD